MTNVLDERRGITWHLDSSTGKLRRSAALACDREAQTCAQCHARRAQTADDYRAGLAFLDHYLPSTLTPELYRPDGQQKDAVFILGSWLQSRMQQAGVTRSDCHDPHSQRLRASGNAVCVQCQAPSTYDTVSHHRHSDGSTGADCVACHMPATTYMVVDPRRDHSVGSGHPGRARIVSALACALAQKACRRGRTALYARLLRAGASMNSTLVATHTLYVDAPVSTRAAAPAARARHPQPWRRCRHDLRMAGRPRSASRWPRPPTMARSPP
ncbi:MAG: hypothetical protein O9284_17295 [Steroidobacteraceae bacterium]|nr:hypothetical protein [Steroidobacteraceae bacterium]